MDLKKKNFLENIKIKLGNKKKARRKAVAQKKKNLANQRSISVPDLHVVPDELYSVENSVDAGPSNAIFFHNSPGVSDTDSITSGSVADGHLCLRPPDRLGDSAPEAAFRFSADHTAAALNSLSAPVEILSHSIPGAVDDATSGSENTTDLTQEPFCAQEPRKAKVNAPTFTLDDRRHVPSTSHVLSSRPDLAERESNSGEDGRANMRVLPGTLVSALVRVHSLGEQRNPYTEKRDVSSERGTPPSKKKITFADRRPLTLEMLCSPESADGTSLDSACGTPSEERVNMSTDSEELDREQDSPFVTREFLMGEAVTEETQPDEEMGEVFGETFDPFDENVQDPSENSATTGGADVQAPTPFQRYLLNIVLKWGKNLVIRDRRAGSSDPYVKFKLEGKQFYKSKVIYKNLNPRWNESFSHPLRDRDHAVEVRVFDKNRTSDDFMGSGAIPLKDLELYKIYEMELQLDDPKSKEDDMGVIVVDVCLMHRDATIKRSPRWLAKKKKQQNQAVQRSAETQKNQTNNQMWSGVLGITLIEGQDLPQNGHGDVYVRFRLGEQKYKSKNLCIQTNPQWREQFDFNQFEDNQEPLQVEVYSKRGRKGAESWGMFEIELSRLPLNEKQLYTHVLDPGKGTLVFLVTLRPCWGVSIADAETALLEKPEEREAVEDRFSLRKSHKCVGEVGFLQVKVIKANDLPTTDLNGKGNPFCVLELGNGKLQSHTLYKTVNPDWNKAFTFPIKDINDVIELTVFDENGDRSPSFLGKVAIPLLTIQNGQEITLFLKKENLESMSKGTITVVLEVIYNKVRAGIKTFQPKEAKFTEENLKFSKKVLARNIYRVRKISMAVLYTLQYIKSCFQWENTQRSLLAFLIFLVTVWHWELFMLPLFLLLLIGWNYIQLTSGKASSNPDLANISTGDDEEEDEKEGAKKGLMDKIHMVQEIVLTVQNILEEIANVGERVKNVVNWSVPFLSVLFCLALFASTLLLYFIPLRYIVLIWGVNKFTKKLRSPYAIDNNEMLDFLRRVPSDVQKVQYSVVRAPTSQNPARKKR